MSEKPIKIETNIPIPGPAQKTTKYLYLVEKMNIGDSILINFKEAASVRNCFWRVFGRGSFTGRQIGEEYRIWRTK